jgi:glycerophosphoryl diester phosphodiesterase
MIRYPRVIAHRCGGTLADENSLAGLTVVARLGCRAVEFDVMLTADGIPILMHDETLDRTTRCIGRVAERTLGEIRACDRSVATLAEALAVCRQNGLWANIELKPSAGCEAATGEIAGKLLAAEWDGQGVVSSFSEKSALAGRRYLPDAAFALLYERLPPDWQTSSVRLGARSVHLAAEALTADIVAELRQADLPVAAYTVNDRKAADRLFSLGVAAVFTDRPDLWFQA